MKETMEKEKLQALKNFFESDMKIKETLVKLAPSKIDDLDESSRIEYVDKLYKGLENLEEEFLSSVEKFEFAPEVNDAIKKYFKKEKETLLVEKYEPGICQKLYASQFSMMDKKFVEEVKKELLENIDMNRWICVSADVLYITNNGNTIFAVMSFEDWATPVYNEFVKYVDNNVGKTLEKTADDIELPETNLPQVTE